MGSGKFDTKKYHTTATAYLKQDRTSLFQQKVICTDFDPLKTTVRESCASKEHPDPTSIIIACDVTGSMGKIPENLLKSGLGKIMESLLGVQSISNPQVMFAAIGDTESDKAPLQVTQFESDNRIEEQLKKLYLEGGGGPVGTESYNVIWYFAAHKTRLDSLKTGKKGFLFTMGDEMVPPILKAEHIRKFIDKDYSGPDISSSRLIEMVSEKYHVFHLIVQDTHAYSKSIGPDKVNTCWRDYLKQHAILVPDYMEIPAKIVQTVKSTIELNTQLNQPISAVAPAEKIEALPSAANAAIIDKVGLFKNKSNNLPSNASEVLSKNSEGIPHMFICPISLTVMENPVLTEDGHCFEQKEISKWFETHDTNPTTNLVIGKKLTPNVGLKSAIIEWQEKQAAHAAAPAI